MGTSIAYRRCPTCNAIYGTADTRCCHDSTPLVDDPRILAGKFILLHRLGQGGMGEVWEADQPTMARRVAIKLLQPQLASDPAFRSRFEREARAAGQLNHPGIVTLYETGQAEGRFYLAMELISGETLTQLMAREGRLSPRRALAIWLPVALAMTIAHQRGVVHRDLKPDNILLATPPDPRAQPQVKVLDFGIAKLRHQGLSATDATAVGVTMGSPRYMAPEQFGGAAEADDRADVFALGVILYELLTGQRPYSTTSLMLTAQPPPPLRQLAPKVSPALAELTARMLAVLPHARPSIHEVAEQVAALAEAAPAPIAPRWRTLGAAAFLASLLTALAVVGLRRAAPDMPGDAAGQREGALRVLKEGLAAPEPNLRAQAAAAIGQGRDPQLHTLLAPLLKDADAEVRAEAAFGLGQLGAQLDAPALAQLATQDPAPVVQVAAASALLRLNRPEGQAPLRRVLQGTTDAALLPAALRLDELGDAAARQRLRAWRDRSGLSDEARLQVLTRLAQGGDGESRQALEALSTAPPSPMHLSAMAGLARLGDARARARLAAAAGQRGPLQVLAAHLLATLGDGSGYALFQAVLRDSAAALATRVLAAAGLAACGRGEGIRALWAALAPKTAQPLRLAAAGAVLRLVEDDPSGIAAQSLSFARAALGDAQWRVRSDAVSVLADVDSAEALTLLGQALRDESVEVRRGAARALGRKPVRAALAQLRSGLDDPDAEVRRAVIQALGQVAGALQARGDAEAAKEVVSKLRDLAQSKSAMDAVMASGTLLVLGDESQKGALQEGLRSPDAQVRRMALELSGADPAALLRALQDADPDVRFTAARLLAAKGLRQGVAALREALGRGGVDGLVAYGLLRRLGEAVAPPTGLAEVLAAADLPTRVAAAAALLDLPAEEAVPLLRRAALDGAAVVRRQVAEAAFGLAQRGHGEGWELLNVLRADADLVVRSRAAMLWAKLGPRPAAAPVAAEVPPAAAAPPDLGQAPVLKQAPLGPQPEQLMKEGALALQARDFRKALQLLDQAEGLAKGRRSVLRTQIWLERGRLYEARERWDQALEEYSKLLMVPPAQRTRAETAAVARLATRFGRLVVSKSQGGRCQTMERFARPGESLVDVGGKIQTLRIRAGDVKELRTCR